MNNIQKRLEKMILKEENYVITVPRNISHKLAPVITSVKNVSVTKSFDLKDLERHRFVVTSMMDAHTIEDALRAKLQDRTIRATLPVSVKPQDIKVDRFTPASMNEAVEDSIVYYNEEEEELNEEYYTSSFMKKLENSLKKGQVKETTYPNGSPCYAAKNQVGKILLFEPTHKKMAEKFSKSKSFDKQW